MNATFVLPKGENFPIYPPSIRGDLRLILQTKDMFLFCNKHLEEYQRLIDEQHRLITKEFVEEQIRIMESEQQELRQELSTIQNRMKYKLSNNEKLAHLLVQMGICDQESMHARRIFLCRSPTMRRYVKCLKNTSIDDSMDAAKEEMLMKLCEIQSECDVKLQPLLDYYKELYYYQLHFTVVQTQLNNYTMPLLTENISLVDRIFFWSDRPEFSHLRETGGELADRLKEIYTRVQQLLAILVDNTIFLRNQVAIQKALEIRFHQYIAYQEKKKDALMRSIHSARQDLDILEEENDRLVGIIVKLDPTFVDTQDFIDVVEDSTRRQQMYSWMQGQMKSQTPLHDVSNILRPLSAGTNSQPSGRQDSNKPHRHHNVHKLGSGMKDRLIARTKNVLKDVLAEEDYTDLEKPKNAKKKKDSSTDEFQNDEISPKIVGKPRRNSKGKEKLDSPEKELNPPSYGAENNLDDSKKNRKMPGSKNIPSLQAFSGELIAEVVEDEDNNNMNRKTKIKKKKKALQNVNNCEVVNTAQCQEISMSNFGQNENVNRQIEAINDFRNYSDIENMHSFDLVFPFEIQLPNAESTTNISSNPFDKSAKKTSSSTNKQKHKRSVKARSASIDMLASGLLPGMLHDTSTPSSENISQM